MKCGFAEGWIGPTYVHGVPAVVRIGVLVGGVPEHLNFTCPSCGFRRHEPCKDATASTKERV